MSGFDKIEFKDEAAPAVSQKPAARVKSTTDFVKSPSAEPTMPKRNKKSSFNFKYSKKLAIILGVIVLIIVLISIPAYATYKSGLQTYREAKLIAAAAKQQNV